MASHKNHKGKKEKMMMKRRQVKRKVSEMGMRGTGKEMMVKGY